MTNIHAARKCMGILVLIMAAPAVFAGYIEDREAAMELMRKRETQAALRAFNEMARGDVTDLQTSDALEQAVLCLIKLKQYDNARATADRIPIQGVRSLSHMRILRARKKDKAIVEQFKNAKIEEWPPLWRGDGYLLRGGAASRTGNGELAASDLENAIVYAATFDNYRNDKARTLNALGEIYRDQLKDEEKAIDAFRRAQAVGSSSKGTRATFAIADIYLKRNEPEKAVDVVKEWTAKVKPEDFGSPYWQKHLLHATVRVLVAAGRKGEAIAFCERALAAEKIHPKVKEYIKKQLSELQGAGATQDEGGKKQN